MVRAKMVLSAITSHSWNAQSKTLKFTAQYDPSIPEDRRFQQATPSGSIEMQVDNPRAVEAFTLGKAYYVDFTEAQ